MSSETASTIGAERRLNPALALATVEEFVAESAAVSVPRPPNMERIVELNRGPFLGAPPPLAPVGLADGAVVLDVRPAEVFAAGQVRGAINVPAAGGTFGTKAAFVLRSGERVVIHASSPEEAELAARRLRAVVIHASSPEEAELAARRLRAVGILELDGYLARPEATATLEPVDLDELERLLEDGAAELVDVRELEERRAGYIAGSRHIPYRLIRACADDLPRDRPVVTVCESGVRAAIAASILAAAGIEARPVLGGGVPDLEARGHRTVEFRRCGP